jgi:hypothetical protein
MAVCEDKTTPVQEMAGVSLALGEMLKRSRVFKTLQSYSHRQLTRDPRDSTLSDGVST